MAGWTVELDPDFHREVLNWSEDRQLELLAIMRVLEQDGLNGLSFGELGDLSSVGSWAQPVSLLLVAPIPGRFRTVGLEFGPGRKILVTSLE
jgi:hypothetical protein